MTAKRIYVVSNGDKNWLVRAANHHVALSAVTKHTFKVRVAEQEDLIGAKKEDVIDAGGA